MSVKLRPMLMKGFTGLNFSSCQINRNELENNVTLKATVHGYCPTDS